MLQDPEPGKDYDVKVSGYVLQIILTTNPRPDEPVEATLNVKACFETIPEFTTTVKITETTTIEEATTTVEGETPAPTKSTTTIAGIEGSTTSQSTTTTVCTSHDGMGSRQYVLEKWIRVSSGLPNGLRVGAVNKWTSDKIIDKQPNITVDFSKNSNGNTYIQSVTLTAPQNLGSSNLKVFTDSQTSEDVQPENQLVRA